MINRKSWRSHSPLDYTPGRFRGINYSFEVKGGSGRKAGDTQTPRYKLKIQHVAAVFLQGLDDVFPFFWRDKEGDTSTTTGTADFRGQGASVDPRLIKDPFDSEVLGKVMSMQLDLPPDFANREHLVNLYYPSDLGSDARIDSAASWKEHGGVEKEFAMSGVAVGPRL